MFARHHLQSCSRAKRSSAAPHSHRNTTLFTHKSPSQLPSFPTVNKRVRNSLNPLRINSLHFPIHAHSFRASPVLSTTSQKTPRNISPSIHCQSFAAPKLRNHTPNDTPRTAPVACALSVCQNRSHTQHQMPEPARTIERDVLPNGLTVITEPMPHVRLPDRRKP